MAKSGFKLPPMSPLAGRSFFNLVQSVSWRDASFRYFPKLVFTTFISLLFSPVRWWEFLKFNRQVREFELKKPPLFILGHWRSGTTFLHNVLCQDPQTAYVSTFQSVFPQALGSQFFLKPFMKAIMPDKRPGDNMELSVDFPQEDEFALSNCTPYSYYNFMYFPKNYRNYYQKHVRFKVSSDVRKDWQEAYLQLIKKTLINSGGERVVLKNPVNTGRINILLEMFPQGKFVFIYRNPVLVYLSAKKFFTQLLPTLQLQAFEKEEIVDLILDVFEKLMRNYLLERNQIPANQLCELRFEYFEKEPLQEVKRIYKSLNLNNLEEALPYFESYFEKTRSFKKNQHRITQNELERVLQRWEFAMEQWNYDVPENIQIKQAELS